MDMNVTNKSFEEIYNRTRGHLVFPDRILCFDPGITTGVCLLVDRRPKMMKQIKFFQADKPGIRLRELIVETQPGLVLFENFRIYASHAKHLINDELLTVQLIGRIKQVCEELDIPYETMMASQSKAFVTDERLVQWGMLKEVTHDYRHTIDSLRLGLSYLLFS